MCSRCKHFCCRPAESGLLPHLPESQVHKPADFLHTSTRLQFHQTVTDTPLSHIAMPHKATGVSRFAVSAAEYRRRLQIASRFNSALPCFPDMHTFHRVPGKGWVWFPIPSFTSSTSLGILSQIWLHLLSPRLLLTTQNSDQLSVYGPRHSTIWCLWF